MTVREASTREPSHQLECLSSFTIESKMTVLIYLAAARTEIGCFAFWAWLRLG